jgi:hypothetical protein
MTRHRIAGWKSGTASSGSRARTALRYVVLIAVGLSLLALLFSSLVLVRSLEPQRADRPPTRGGQRVVQTVSKAGLTVGGGPATPRR